MRRAAEQDIVEAGHLGRQLGVLRHVGDEPGSLAVAETAGRAVREPDVAGRADHAGDRPEQGRLARAVRADQRGPVAGGHADADVVQGHGRAEADPQAVHADHDESALARRERSTNRKNGAPTAAVMTPIGTSVSGWTVLAAMSASTRKAAPPIMETGSTTR